MSSWYFLFIHFLCLVGSGKSHICHSVTSTAPWLSLLHRPNSPTSSQSIPLCITIDVSQYLKPSNSFIFSLTLPSTESPIVTLHSRDISSPESILQQVDRVLNERISSDQSLEGQLRAITAAALLLQSYFTQYIQSVDQINKRSVVTDDSLATSTGDAFDSNRSLYLSTGGGLIFAIFKNLEKLNPQLNKITSNDSGLSLLSSSRDLLLTSKPDRERIVSRLIEHFLIQWNQDLLPIVLITITDAKVDDTFNGSTNPLGSENTMVCPKYHSYHTCIKIPCVKRSNTAFRLSTIIFLFHLNYSIELEASKTLFHSNFQFHMKIEENFWTFFYTHSIILHSRFNYGKICFFQHRDFNLQIFVLLFMQLFTQQFWMVLLR